MQSYVLLVTCCELNGPMAERLGRGLQNLARRFNSASDLKNHIT